ncbi:MAG TPA: hypothetical protein VFA74_09400 [Terriglobales bacterium]|nr:hypothetical protein [Terriglobales bacterium]
MNQVLASFLFLSTLPCFAQQYVIKQSHITESLRGLSTPSSKIAWASGTHGIFLRSLDGGNSWQAAKVPGAESLDFRDVEAFDADMAYMLSAGPGDQSRIYKTSNAGKTWSLQFTNKDPKGFYDCMAFWDRDHGIALGDPVDGHFTLITTENSGNTWNQTPSENLPSAIEGEGAFAASGTCITVEGKNNVWFATGGKVARVFRSTDRGRSWHVVNTPIVHGEEATGIFSIAFRDSRHGVIAGGDYKQPTKSDAYLAFTEDGGVTWSLHTILPGSYFSAINFAPRGGLLAVGSSQAAYSKSIQQPAWTKHWDLNLNAAKFNSANTALAVGPKGTIVKFSDIP